MLNSRPLIDLKYIQFYSGSIKGIVQNFRYKVPFPSKPECYRCVEALFNKIHAVLILMEDVVANANTNQCKSAVSVQLAFKTVFCTP